MIYKCCIGSNNCSLTTYRSITLNGTRGKRSYTKHTEKESASINNNFKNKDKNVFFVHINMYISEIKVNL